MTEFLVQSLANARRAVYRDKYVSRGFVAFAIAYRFVLAATGHETGLVPLGVSAVG